MSVQYTSRTENVGNMRCHTTYTDKKGEFTTDVPTDIGGLGEFPSPGMMLASCVASCMLSMISFKGESKGLKTEGIRIDAAEENGSKGITALHFDIHVPHPCNMEMRKLLEAAAQACPVGKAIHPDIEKHINWHWTEPD